MSDNGSPKERKACKFKCLRCGLLYDGSFIPGVMEELECPQCGSNSQRRLKDKAAAGSEA